MEEPMGRTPIEIVMVIEDDAATRDAVVEALGVCGYRVLAAENGKRALDLLRKKDGVRPCMILLDLMMPVMDGWEFWAEKQEDPAIASIPVVVLTADTGSRQRVTELGIAAFIAKPIELPLLLQTIERLC
jgi:CheY-like chemotaxis protein